MSYERLAILLAVAAGPISGAEIAGQVLADSVGGIIISKSTAYRLISELEERGLIENRGGYALTNAGWRALRGELNRVEQQIRILKSRLHI